MDSWGVCCFELERHEVKHKKSVKILPLKLQHPCLNFGHFVFGVFDGKTHFFGRGPYPLRFFACYTNRSFGRNLDYRKQRVAVGGGVFYPFKLFVHLFAVTHVAVFFAEPLIRHGVDTDVPNAVDIVGAVVVDVTVKISNDFLR